MFKASVLIVLVGACVASAGVLSRNPTISKEFQKINEWLVDNVPDNTDGFVNVHKAAAYAASARSSMSEKERDAWELFGALEQMEENCSRAGAKLIHSNFEQAALPWPFHEEAAKTRINAVLLDVQAKTLARCGERYEEIVRSVDPIKDGPNSVKEFMIHWSGFLHRKWDRESLYPEWKYFAGAIEKQGYPMMASILYQSIKKSRPNSETLVAPKVDKKTKKKEPVNVEDAKIFLNFFFVDCAKITGNLGEVVDTMMISQQSSYVKDMWRQVEICQRVTSEYNQDKLAKTLIKISLEDFDVPWQ